MMKKIMCLMAALTFACILSACSTEPLQCSIGELNYELPGEYTQESDPEVARKNLDETFEAGEEASIDVPDFTIPSIVSVDGESTLTPAENEDAEEEEEDESLTAKDYYDVQWFESGDYTVSVTAHYSPHNNDDLAGAIEGVGWDAEDPNYTSFEVDGSQGRHGKDYIGVGSINYDFDLIHNGMLYTVTFYNQGDDLDEYDIEDFISALAFDDSTLKDITVDCGDIHLSLSGEYQPIELDEIDGARDLQGFARFGKARTEFSINYFNANDYQGPEAIAEYMKSSIGDTDYAERTEEIGKCYYLSGRNDDNGIALAVFEDNDKIYVLELDSEDELAIEDMEKIVKTIKK